MKALPILIGLTFFLLQGFLINAQNLYPVTTLPVYDGEGCLQNPWAGGLNNPQFTEIDLNEDSFMDMLIFDKTGDKVLTFINKGTPGMVDYHYAPEYEDWFPVELRNWVIVRDYNCDNVPDLWTSVPQGVRIYEGTRKLDGSLEFNSIGNYLEYEYTGGVVNILVSPVDYPAMEDIDGDGDIDILTFGIFGTSVEYYKNISKDSSGSCGARFVLAETCWGKFIEGNNDNKIYLGACKKFTGGGGQGEPGNPRHAGSTLCLYDDEGDGDMEAIIGDLISNNFVQLTNGGSVATAQMAALDSSFPVYDTPLDLPVFPAGFYMDVNNDGNGDLLAGPNSPTASNTIGNSWYYQDIDPTLGHDFELQTDSFLSDGMIEVGDHAYPSLFDYNGDGRKDLLVGNFNYFKEASGNLKSGLALYENTGTNTDPEFTLKTRNYMGIYSLNLNNINATFGDLDGDGDTDMLLGEEDGFVHFMENTSSGGNAIFSLKTPNLYGIDVGQFSVPFLIDLNGDNELDLVIGRKDGKLSYYQNTLDPDTLFKGSMSNHFFGEVKVNKLGFVDGYSAPHVWIDDTTNQIFLFVGSEQGYIFKYEIDPDSLLSGKFKVVDTIVKTKDFGSRTSIHIADLNNDGPVEYLIGTERGGLHLYSEAKWTNSYVCVADTSKDTTSDTTNTIVPIFTDNYAYQMFPNPNNGQFQIRFTRSEPFEKINLKVMDVLGREVYARESGFDVNFTVSLNTVDAGMYILEVNIDGLIDYRKFTIE